MVGIKSGKPICYLLNGGISIAIFIQERIIFNLKTHMVDTIHNGINEIIATVLQITAIILNKVIASFDIAIIITVQGSPFLQIILTNVLIHGLNFIEREFAVSSCTDFIGGFEDNLIHAIGHCSCCGNGLCTSATGYTGVGIDIVD